MLARLRLPCLVNVTYLMMILNKHACKFSKKIPSYLPFSRCRYFYTISLVDVAHRLSQKHFWFPDIYR